MTNWRTFFLVAAVYDIVLGVAFFLLYGPLFSALGIELPNNTSYIHLTAAFVFTQGLGYWFVYQDPPANLGIVKLGIVYKAIFSGLAFYYLAIGQLLHPVFVVFGVVDLLFLIGFWLFLRQPSEVAAAA
ncbi:MAG TPA: hypothetical protein VJ975_04690 [Candidatus Limnocylindria bacterium]|nr:hypothetical protein [Candidatus Limnocylindria bacterium]